MNQIVNYLVWLNNYKQIYSWKFDLWNQKTVLFFLKHVASKKQILLSIFKIKEDCSIN